MIVAKLEPDGVAAERGFHIGDIILDIGGEVVRTLVDFNNGLAAAKQAGQVALARVKSDDTTRFIAIPVG
ncbi:PDZ domain-containing protein [Bradyrhizobium sp. LHD-71]|uniref:PDZ domain-containing protein n=1 Tax=Bradyrhizobium sp. LHD-71 TaxID=3072141 RepID=UPI00280CEBB1|nr:PDZ domain-containing protein [Bradyrhizobium sp. LHD-71]MDQ8727959.1 PDZ domain-containing protein [Bradyrhizobium sp. LHD-71]